jgi:ComF family protein
VIAPFVYDASIAFLLREWKYRGQRHLVSLAARLAREAAPPAEDDALWLATPLHWTRRLQRGFNQSEDLLRVLAPPESGLLRGAGKRPRLQRTRSTPKQALASRGERRRNLADAFRVLGALEGRSVVVIDDVCTTGATAAAMARSLARAGAGPVTLWCIARTPAPWRSAAAPGRALARASGGRRRAP